MDIALALMGEKGCPGHTAFKHCRRTGRVLECLWEPQLLVGARSTSEKPCTFLYHPLSLEGSLRAWHLRRWYRSIYVGPQVEAEPCTQSALCLAVPDTFCVRTVFCPSGLESCHIHNVSGFYPLTVVSPERELEFPHLVTFSGKFSGALTWGRELLFFL